MSEATAQDPVAYFLEDITYHGKTERTRDAYERVLREFEAFLRDREGREVSLESATRRDCMAYVHQLRGDLAGSTVATYASYLHRFYAYMTQVGEFEANPMAVVVEEMDERIDTDPARREIDVPEMRAFVAGIGHPLDRAVVCTLLKTGVRAGELCNIDAQDVHLTGADGLLSDTPRGTIEGRPDSIYVDDDPTRGAVVNGEERTASNKRKRPTTIPIDDELGTVLRQWLAVRPDPQSDADPLFCQTSGDWGARLTPTSVHRIVTDHAEAHGWYRAGGGAEENVTPHYFRHFFTTHLRDRTGDRGIVKYIRGDVAGDIVDTYTHNWGDRVRELYEANIYEIL
jgi:integrase